MRFFSFGVVFLCTMIPLKSFANTDYYYFGAALQSQETRDVNFSSEFSIDSYNHVDFNRTISSGGYRIFGGYAFNNYISTEVDFTKYESQKFTMISNDGSGQTNLSGSSDSESIGTQLVFNIPVRHNISLRAKLGLIAWQNSVDTLTIQNNFPKLESDSSSGFDLTTGLGAHYAVTRNVALILDWDNRNVGRYNVESWGVSVAVAF